MENNNSVRDSEKTNNVNNIIVLGSDNFIAALFNEAEVAETTYENLQNLGYSQDDITLVMSEDTRNNYFPDTPSSTTTTDIKNKSLEGLGVGAAIGGSLGSLAAAIAAMGTSLVIPGLNLVVAGSLAAGLAGAGAGAAAGGVVGAIIGLGIPNEAAKFLAEGVKNGGVIVGVNARNEVERNELHKQWLALQNNTSHSTFA